MALVLLVAGIGFLLAGLLAIGFGIPVNEFSLGNTLILAGSVTACTGMILIGLWTVVRELAVIARRLDRGSAASRAGGSSASPAATLRDQTSETGGFFAGLDKPETEGAGNTEPPTQPSATSPAPWQDEAAARRQDTPGAPPPAEEAPPPKRRNLLFSSSSRKERERAQARTEPPEGSPASAPAAPPPATFDDAWPQTERPKSVDVSPPRRAPRAPSTFTDATPPGGDRYSPAPRAEEQPPVTVLKSGVVDGMAYSLYSDGSIEAQMPEGMMRFASIDELRAHLDQRP